VLTAAPIMPTEADGNRPKKHMIPAISVPKFTLKARGAVPRPG
jgi:hypothetical protein